MDDKTREAIIRSQVERLEAMSHQQNDNGQVLVHWSHLRGIAAQLRSTLLLDAAVRQKAKKDTGFLADVGR
jgi:LAS superfamily LD-carboxypeptidase LdcB